MIKIDFDDLYDYDDDYKLIVLLYGLSYGMNALLFLFYPLAGFLADVCWGRYATVKNSLWFLFWSIILVLFAASLVLLGSTLMITRYTIQVITVAVVCVVFGLPAICGVVLFFVVLLHLVLM